jgi:signal peptidase I
MRGLVAPFLLVLASVAALFRFAIRRYRVEGESMLASYRPGERLLVESVSYRLREPRIGEAVVVRQPGGNGRLDLKRIAAGPGASVMVRGEEWLLGSDEWFLLSDNLDHSTDSRDLGPVSKRDIVGRVWLRY